MAGDEDRVEPIDQSAKAREMRPIDAVGAADRDADRVHRERVVAREIRQQLDGVRIGEEVLRMDLEPADGRASGHHLRDVREPQADAGPFSCACRRDVSW